MRLMPTFLISSLLLVACTGNIAEANKEFASAMVLINNSDEAKAAEGRNKLEHAAQLGSPEAAVTLGYYFLKGTQGFSANPKKAFDLFEKAAKTGHINAEYNTGLAYMRGIGTSVNLAKAYEWFLKAALHGDAGAQYNTAVMLLSGDGVAADPLKAYAWFTLAAEQGHDGAEEDRVQARRMLTSEKMQELEKTLSEIRSQITKPTVQGAGSANAPL